jgi:hypothetical protein
MPNFCRPGTSVPANNEGRPYRGKISRLALAPIAVAVAVAVPVGPVLVGPITVGPITVGPITAGPITAGAAPVASAATKPPGCAVVPSSLVGTVYGASFGPPKAQTSGPVQVCFFSAVAPVITVLVRFQAGESDAAFNAARKQFDARGEHTVASRRFGPQAFTVVLGSGRAETGTVVVLKGSTELLVSGTGSLAKCEALANKVLPKL